MRGYARFSWNLLAARCTGRHPDVAAAQATGARRGEDQGAPVVRETRLDVVGGGAQRGAEILRWRPGVVDAATHGPPEVRRTEAPCAIGIEKHLATIDA